MKFSTTIHQTGNNTGIEVPETILEKLGGGNRPLVVVTLNNYTYRSAVGKMGGKFLVSLSAENRKKANVAGGQRVEVTLQLDTEPRTVDLPEALVQAFTTNKKAKASFEKLAPSKQKAMVLSITGAKTDETRDRRVAAALESLKG